ncbi:hypothetical protein ACFQ67_31190 [Streptomyces sp. NPDC056488]|uniref:hypothetical protein n=1 Tax=unclassified Streptomyces TaxID=2593676 RepID=UPI0036773017
MAEAVGALTLQGGLQQPLRQLLKQSALTGQLQILSLSLSKEGHGRRCECGVFKLAAVDVRQQVARQAAS